MKRWMKRMKWALLAAVTLSAGTGLAAQKKNVCAMTINSSDEIDLFKKHLSKDQFNFIELTEVEDKKGASSSAKEEESENAWLKASCRQGIKCDVLVISGHFGGSFFGSSDINLPLETLESASCDSACSGILHEPKEVFLFGCNTLAGKERDSRTPEQYARVLVNDGFSEIQAQQIAAFRYSAIGSSFSDRMSRVFAKVPRIYGFSSIAPSGKTVTPHLTRYLKDTAPTYFEQLTTMTATPNTALRERLKGQPLAQVSGVENTNTPVCYIKSEKTSTIGKLQYVLDVLEQGGALELAPYLSEYFKNLDEKKLNPAERRMLEKVHEHTAGREKLASFISKPIKGLLKPQVDTLNLMYNINWINEKDYNQHMDALVLHTLYKKETLLTRELADQLCSLDTKVRSVDVNRIPSGFWNKREFYEILNCLKPQNEAVIERVSMQMLSLVQTMQQGEESRNSYWNIETVRQMLRLLIDIRNLSEGVIERMISVLAVDTFMPYIAMTAEDGQFTSKKLRLEIERILKNQQLSPQNAVLARSAILSLGREDEKFMRAQYEDYVMERGEFEKHNFKAALEKSASLREMIFADFKNTKDERRLRQILHLFYGHFLDLSEHRSSFEEILLNESLAPNTRQMALAILMPDGEQHESFVALLRKILKSKTHFQVRASAWDLLSISVANIPGEASALLAQETHPIFKKILELHSVTSSEQGPYHHYDNYRTGKVDTDSSLFLALQQGKETYTLIPRNAGSSPPKGNFEKREIVLGVDEKKYNENKDRSFVEYRRTKVLYDIKNNAIVGFMLESPLVLHEVPLAEDSLILTRNQVDRVVFLGTALQINPTSGKIVQDYSESLYKVQSEILSELKRNPEYKKFIESVSEISFHSSGKNDQDLTIGFSVATYERKLSAVGSLQFTPGPNGKGTVQVKNLQVDYKNRR